MKKTTFTAWLVLLAMLIPVMLHAQDADTATLMIVASDGGDPGRHEFLIIQAAGDTISWSLVCPKGFTATGVDPEGAVVIDKGIDPEDKGRAAQGTIAGNPEQLRKAFRSTLGEIAEAKPPKRGKNVKVPADFSLILMDSAGVRTCQLWSGKQQKQLVFGDDLKDVFDEIRKKTWGAGFSGYMTQDLIYIGGQRAMIGEMGEPKVPVRAPRRPFPDEDIPQWTPPAPSVPPLPPGRSVPVQGGPKYDYRG